MRDPDARLEFTSTEAVRHLFRPISDADFLASALARQWVARGVMLPFELRDRHTVASQRVPLVTFPTEWCDAQLCDAARLTLELQSSALEQGFDLKDASAWNVIFQGPVPSLCDHLSPVPLKDLHWWAAGQFSRHFLLPLWIASTGRLRTCDAFRLRRDGIPVAEARRMIGIRRYLHRCAPLLHTGGSALPSGTPASNDISEIRAFRARLHNGLSWMLKGVVPGKPQKLSDWSGYEQDRGHYAGRSLELKREWVGRTLQQLRPRRVVDLGCNAGEFSQLALEADAEVVAIDGDHDSIQTLYRDRAHPRMTPVIATLDDLSGGQGWAGTEFAGLMQRLQGYGDLVMMLGLVHHLAIGASVPLQEIAGWCARLTRRWLIVELVAPQDVQASQLLQQRRRDPDGFSVARQRSAFEACGFKCVAAVDLDGVPRTLILFERGHAG
ncbi:MAG: class I SAM-dependent methyltransferase [Rubrivivax sp.]|nr:class I SAM-dependent methyltransferase [Rubrivivax sp.]